MGHAWLHTVDREVLHGKTQTKVEKGWTSSFENSHNTTQYNSNIETNNSSSWLLTCHWCWAVNGAYERRMAVWMKRRAEKGGVLQLAWPGFPA